MYVCMYIYNMYMYITIYLSIESPPGTPAAWENAPARFLSTQTIRLRRQALPNLRRKEAYSHVNHIVTPKM